MADARSRSVTTDRPTNSLRETVSSEEERRLASIWCRLLEVETVARDDSFFDLGGHSLLLVQLAAEIEAVLGKQVPLAELFQHATLEAQTELLNAPPAAGVSAMLQRIRCGSGPTLIVLPVVGGVGRLSQDVVDGLPSDVAIAGVSISYATGGEILDTIEKVAAHCVAAITASSVPQPYHLTGFSWGGIVAYEVARQLVLAGFQVGLVGVIDTGPVYTLAPSLPRRLLNLRYFAANAPFRIRAQLRDQGLWNQLHFLANAAPRAIRRVTHNRRSKISARAQPIIDARERPAGSSAVQKIEGVHMRALFRYVPAQYDGKVTLFRARIRPLLSAFAPDCGWAQAPIQELEIRWVPGTHEALLQAPCARALAAQIHEALHAACGGDAP